MRNVISPQEMQRRGTGLRIEWRAALKRSQLVLRSQSLREFEVVSLECDFLLDDAGGRPVSSVEEAPEDATARPSATLL